MPINLPSIYRQLTENADFIKYSKLVRGQESSLIQQLLQKTFQLSYETLVNSRQEAIPTREYIDGLFISFDQSFTTMQEMMRFAIDESKNTPTGSVDGSQIYPNRAIDPSFGLIQAVAYRNDHVKEKKYQTLQQDRVLFPTDFPNERTHINTIDLMRHKFELELLQQIFGGRSGIMFFDGTIILSYLSQYGTQNETMVADTLQTFHLMLNQTFHNDQILIGYIDPSSARDVLSLASDPTNPTFFNYMTDAMALEQYFESQYHCKMQLGDRTCVFICNRSDSIYHQYPSDHQIGFFYIKLYGGHLVRIEFPMKYMSMIDKIWKMVIAEAILGSGYPYCIDYCHHKAIISHEDEMRFYRVIDQISEFPIQISQKLKNKLMPNQYNFLNKGISFYKT